jgi:hypothetical protein
MAREGSFPLRLKRPNASIYLMIGSLVLWVSGGGAKLINECVI